MCALLVVTAGVKAESPKLTRASEVLEAVRIQGAAATVADLWQSDTWRRYMDPGVRSADPEWLAAAKAIRGATDAGSSEELDDALSAALLKGPYATLPIVREVWWSAAATEMCVFGGDSELPGGVRAYIGRLEKILRPSAPPGAEQVREQCLRGLAKTRRALAGK